MSQAKFLRIIMYKSKTTIFSFQRRIIITFLFWKQIIISKHNLKIGIKGIYDWLEMCDDIIISIKYYLSTYKKFYSCCTRSGNTTLSKASFKSVVRPIRTSNSTIQPDQISQKDPLQEWTQYNNHNM